MRKSHRKNSEFTNPQNKKLRVRSKKFEPAKTEFQGNKKPIKIQSFVLDFYKTGFGMFSPALPRLKKAEIFKTIIGNCSLDDISSVWHDAAVFEINCYEINHRQTAWK